MLKIYYFQFWMCTKWCIWSSYFWPDQSGERRPFGHHCILFHLFHPAPLVALYSLSFYPVSFYRFCIEGDNLQLAMLSSFHMTKFLLVLLILLMFYISLIYIYVCLLSYMCIIKLYIYTYITTTYVCVCICTNTTW